MNGHCDARPTVTFPAAEHCRYATGTKLYSLVTEAPVWATFAKSLSIAVEWLRVSRATSRVASRRPYHYTIQVTSLYRWTSPTGNRCVIASHHRCELQTRTTEPTTVVFHTNAYKLEFHGNSFLVHPRSIFVTSSPTRRYPRDDVTRMLYEKLLPWNLS